MSARDPGTRSSRATAHPTHETLNANERTFFDGFWERTTVPHRLTGSLDVPGVESLEGLRVLICSCGSGAEPVLAARAGALVSAFDISPVGVDKAREVADHNGAAVDFRVMDFHTLEYPDESFDVIYGSAILHHVDCKRVGPEIWRCLAPGGVAYFRENSDRNPLLRWTRRLLFGRPGGVQRRRFLGLHRAGTTDEYPLTEDEVRILNAAFECQLVRMHQDLLFFELFARHGWRNARFQRSMAALDEGCGRAAPWLKRWGYLQDLWVRKPLRAERD